MVRTGRQPERARAIRMIHDLHDLHGTFGGAALVLLGLACLAVAFVAFAYLVMAGIGECADPWTGCETAMGVVG